MDVWDVNGEWSITQNDGNRPTFVMQQQGANFRGLGSFVDANGNLSNGNGSGFISGNQFVFTIQWDNGSRGEYSGNFSSSGRLSGVTFDLNNPRNQGTWVSSKTFGILTPQ
jgi:hypothetical protein